MNDISLGRISAAVGLKGEVRVKAYDYEREDFERLPYLCVSAPKGEPVRHTVESIRTVPKTGELVIKLSDVSDRTAAELLKGSELVVKREDAPKLPKGTYYLGDLIGLNVVNEKGEPVGTVKNVRTGAQSLYEIEDGGRVYLVPSVRAYVERVDTETRTLFVKNVQELREL